MPKNGVLNLGCTFPKLLKIRPSLDIAYRILGSGYMAPNMLKANNYSNHYLNNNLQNLEHYFLISVDLGRSDRDILSLR